VDAEPKGGSYVRGCAGVLPGIVQGVASIQAIEIAKGAARFAGAGTARAKVVAATLNGGKNWKWRLSEARWVRFHSAEPLGP